MQVKYPEKQFLIPAVTEDLVEMTSSELVHFYKSEGRVFGIFDTLGGKHDLDKQREEYGIDVAYQVPARNQSEIVSAPDFTENPEYVNLILHIIKQARTGQPIILLTKDANHARALFAVIKERLEEAGRPFEIGGFTGEESEEVRELWLKNNAGKPNTITIAPSSLATYSEFTTEHDQGFLTVQTSVDTSIHTKQILEGVSSNDTHGQYAVIFENNGTLFSNSWTFKAEKDRQNIVNSVERIRRKQHQDKAVERYYLQTVSSINKPC